MIEALLQCGKEVGFTTVEVFSQQREIFSLEGEGQDSSRQEGKSAMVSVRAFWDKGDPVGFALSAPDLKAGQRAFAEIRNHTFPQKKENFASCLPAGLRKSKLLLCDPGFDGIDERSLDDLLGKVRESAWAFSGLRLQHWDFSKVLERVHLANSQGLQGKYRKTAYHLQLAFSWQGHQIEVSEDRLFFGHLNPERLVFRAGNLLLSLHDPGKAEGAVEHLVLSPEAAAALLNDFSQSWKLGDGPVTEPKIIASAQLSVLDNPELPEQAGSVPFDDEGVQSGEKHLINKGVWQGPVCDIRSAFLHGRASSGNGFRDERAIFPSPQFSNLYIKPSALPLAKLLHDFRHGILISLVKAKAVERQLGRWLYSAYGFSFSGEEIGQPVHFYLHTSPKSFLMRVQRVSRELRFFGGRFPVGAPYVAVSGKFHADGTFHA